MNHFRPSIDYTAMTNSALAEEWLKMAPDNLQRFFINKEFRSRAYVLADSDEKTQRRFKLKAKHEQARFNLQPEETLIYCLDDEKAQGFDSRLTINTIIALPMIIIGPSIVLRI